MTERPSRARAVRSRARRGRRALRDCTRLGVLVAALGCGLAVIPEVHAEPYLAARVLGRCSGCHIDPTGGGERTAGGREYGQKTLARAPFDITKGATGITGAIAPFLSIGADLRAINETVRLPRGEGGLSNEFRTEEANLYITAVLLADRLSFHIDERLAPGGALNREAYVQYSPKPAGLWLKVGRFFPPFGLRLYDDGAFIRNGTGFSFQTPDEGIEIGAEPGKYSFAGSLTNGAGGGSENDTSKLVSFHAYRLLGPWRLGVSGSNNVTGGTRTSIAGAFGSVTFGDFVLLAEGDVRYDRTAGRATTAWIGFFEEYWEVTQGLTLRVSHEYMDPDRDVRTDARIRSGAGVSWFPVGGLELEARVLRLRGPRQRAGQNRWSVEAGAHLYF